MRVKVGDTWYDSKDQPILVELTDADKRNIGHMLASCDKYAEWQKDQFKNSDACVAWMTEGSKNGR